MQLVDFDADQIDAVSIVQLFSVFQRHLYLREKLRWAIYWSKSIAAKETWSEIRA